MIHEWICIVQSLHLGVIHSTDVYACFIWIIGQTDSSSDNSIAVGVGVECDI
jgi:hypothetical protein